MKGAILIPASCIALFFSCSSNPETKTEKAVAKTTTTDFRPLKGVDVETEARSFEAEKGDTFIFPSGSKLIFPANSVLSADGNPVKGKVDIAFKEYCDPIDFFVSGIPMSYDSAGKSFTFESAAMCDLRAFQDKIELKVNPAAQPKVFLGTNNNDLNQNLYRFDETSRTWSNIGKSRIEKTQQTPNEANAVFDDGEAIAPNESGMDIDDVVALKPRLANPKRPQLEIELDPKGGFPEELKVYNNQRFEVAEEDRNYNEKDGDLEWYSVKVEATAKEGLYKATFSRPNKTSTYLVRPVLSGADYEKALKVFKQKQLDHEKFKTARLEAEQSRALQNELLKKEKEAQRSRNLVDPQLIQLRKEVIAKENIRREKLMKEDPKNTIEGTRILERQMYRSFSISEFGVYNCDRPWMLDDMPLMATFKDAQGNELHLKDHFTQIGRFNGLLMSSGNKLRYHPDSAFYFMAAFENKLYFFKQPQAGKMRKNASNGELVMQLNSTDKLINSTEEIRELLYN